MSHTSITTRIPKPRACAVPPLLTQSRMGMRQHGTIGNELNGYVMNWTKKNYLK